MIAFFAYVVATAVTLLPMSTVQAAERHMMAPRVPADQLEAARALTNPLAASPDILAQGKALYEGKGTCVNCHGREGRGDGPLASSLDPVPRNFHHHGFWRHRTDGEIFWVIKHGSAGTSMVGFSQVLSDEEIWAIIEYEKSFSGDHMGGMGRRRGMGGSGCCGPPDSSP
ncbi:c-type cytochrome [Candidatus Nitrospira bockiana]